MDEIVEQKQSHETAQVEFVNIEIHDQTPKVIIISTNTTKEEEEEEIDNNNNNIRKRLLRLKTLTSSPIITKFHAGYFRISLSLSGQALLWKVLTQPDPTESDPHPLRTVFRSVPHTAFSFLWSLAFLTLSSQSLLYALRCLFHSGKVKAEFLHHVGVNYLFAPWVSWLLLLQSSPFIAAESLSYQLLWCALVLPIVVLDIKIYGQWFTKGKRFLSTVANPTSLMTVIGNLVAARAAAEMGWREGAVAMFGLGMAHYLVLFVTLYQRLAGCSTLPAMLRPVFFLFFGAPSFASLAWYSISTHFDPLAKMFFFLSLFLFMSLVSRPALFRKAMRKFTVAWWAYSFPLSVLALASVEYSAEVNGVIAHIIMIALSGLSFLVCLFLILITAIHSNMLLPDNISKTSSNNITRPTRCNSA